MAVEFWTPVLGLPRAVIRSAREAEAAGWDGVLAPESPKATPDPFIDLALAARETETIKFGTGVAIPVPRIAIGMASAAATVQEISNGRFVLSIGRGDSGQAHLGMAPAPVPFFERYVTRLQAYLSGERVSHDLQLDGAGGQIPPARELGMVDYPETSRLAWLPPQLPKVPLLITATGPRMLKLAARVGDGVVMAVGAETSRISTSLDAVRQARADVGQTMEGFTVSAYVSVVPHDDLAVARRMASGIVASFARFSAMHGQVTGAGASADSAIYKRLHDAYTMRGHMRDGSPQSMHLTDEFIDRFAIVGPVDHCIARLTELAGLGVTRLVISPPGFGADDVQTVRDRITAEVLPGVREATAETVGRS
ncbi:LLM class flavin-dependent oxidoreductase [Kibdelosporangium aridum]|uniref:LLM class flavin-dependent oxidoreductase n=1 Tax=Kibdelosporangium aridum TaxID=2030 RepID=UPI0005249E4C